jgi:hypothetical protein
MTAQAIKLYSIDHRFLTFVHLISGTFIARQSRFVPCGYTIASMSMVLKFLIGPVVMLLASLAIGMHGTLLHIAVVQVRMSARAELILRFLEMSNDITSFLERLAYSYLAPIYFSCMEVTEMPS